MLKNHVAPEFFQGEMASALYNRGCLNQDLDSWGSTGFQDKPTSRDYGQPTKSQS